MEELVPALLAAPFVGSLLGVLVRRLPAGRPVALDRSRCEGCGRPLGPLELVPLLSFALQRGRCRHCGARISPAHPAIELAACLVPLCVLAAGVASPTERWADCALGWTLLALAWIDWEHLLLPDVLTLPLLLGGLGATLLLRPEEAPAHAAGAALGWLGFRLLALAHRRLRGREGLGEGDAKLLGAGGAWLGPSALPATVLVAALLGLLLALPRRPRPGTPVPFGPALVAAIWLLRLCPGLVGLLP